VSGAYFIKYSGGCSRSVALVEVQQCQQQVSGVR